MNSSRCTDSIANFELNGATLVRSRPVYQVLQSSFIAHFKFYIYSTCLECMSSSFQILCLETGDTQLVYKRGRVLTIYQDLFGTRAISSEEFSYLHTDF